VIADLMIADCGNAIAVGLHRYPASLIREASLNDIVVLARHRVTWLRAPFVVLVTAVSWALRSLVVWDARAVSRFLREHDAVLVARVKREVGTKLRTGRKHVLAAS